MQLFRKLSNLAIFVKSFIFSVLGIFLGYLLFRGETSLISVFLTTLSLLWTVNFLFERNSREIWEKVTTPYKANKKLAVSLLCIFFGIMLGYGTFVIFTNTSIVRELLSRQLGIYKDIKISIHDINFGIFRKIFTDNIAVFLIVFFLALIYRLGGVLLVIAWNASIWGSVFFYVIKMGPGLTHINPIKYFTATILCIFPHLFTEAAGYVLCSMSGYFISKGVLKYELSSDKFLKVLKASIIIFSISLILILFSALLESGLTPKLISIFFR